MENKMSRGQKRRMTRRIKKETSAILNKVKENHSGIQLNLPLFSGEGDSEIEINDFLEKFEAAANENGLNTDELKSLHFGYYTKGVALVVYEALDMLFFCNWNWKDLKQCFQRKFPQSNCQVLAELDKIELEQNNFKSEHNEQINSIRMEDQQQNGQNRGWTESGTFLCYFCHQEGHLQKYCYQRIHQQRKKKEPKNGHTQDVRTDELIASLNDQKSLN
jgi:hypothetical protein